MDKKLRSKLNKDLKNAFEKEYKKFIESEGKFLKKRKDFERDYMNISTYPESGISLPLLNEYNISVTFEGDIMVIKLPSLMPRFYIDGHWRHSYILPTELAEKLQVLANSKKMKNFKDKITSDCIVVFEFSYKNACRDTDNNECICAVNALVDGGILPNDDKISVYKTNKSLPEDMTKMLIMSKKDFINYISN